MSQIIHGDALQEMARTSVELTGVKALRAMPEVKKPT